MRYWTRSELKERAKAAFKRNYWLCVLAALILAFVCGNGTGGSRSRDNGDAKDTLQELRDSGIVFSAKDLDAQDLGNFVVDQVGGTAASVGKGLYGIMGGVVGMFVIMVLLVAFAIGIALKVLVANPVEVGGCKFFVENELGVGQGLGSMIDAFRGGHYGNVTVAMFMRDLKVFLWTLLLVIPGIIKKYEYRMVPYILAEHPELSYQEVLALSSQMMDGQKANAFVLDLSFIGWEILSGMTCGVLGFFWVNPYRHCTNAELYLELSS